MRTAKFNLKIVALVCLLTVFLLALHTRETLAKASPSPSPTDPISTNSALLNIKQRVEMVKQTEPQVEGAQTSQIKFGIIGTLDKVVGSSLQISTPEGSTRLAELDHGAVIIKDGKPIAREEIEVNVPVIAIGFRQTDNTLLVRRLIFADDTLFGTKRATLFGKMVSLTTKLLTLLGFQNGQSSNLAIKLSTRTSYLNTLGSTIKRTDLNVGDPVIAIFSTEETASSSAAQIYSLSPSAVPSPTVIPVPGL